MFENCKTAEELKAAYKDAVKVLHPDNNKERDTTREFQTMQSEFIKLWDKLKTIHISASDGTYTKETTETPYEFINMVEALRKLSGVVVELCGSWLWVTGETYQHRKALSALGFKWAKSKSAWYFHFGTYHKYGKKSYSMDTIRAMWGSAEPITQTEIA